NFIHHADADDLADERCLAWSALEQRHGRGAAVEPGLLQSALHHLELVGPIAELTQFGFHLAVEHPHALLAFLGQPQSLEGLEAANAQGPLDGAALLRSGDGKHAVLGAGHERPVKLSEALLPDLVEELLDPLNFGLGAELKGNERLGPGAHAVAD